MIITCFTYSTATPYTWSGLMDCWVQTKIWNQLPAVFKSLKGNLKITNSQYQEEFGVAKRTASKDLQLLTSLGLVSKEGTTGKGVFYKITKGASKGHKGH